MTTHADASNQIPEGYRAISINESGGEAMLRLCVVAKTTPDSVAGHLVLLRNLPDAQVYLGCVADRSGRVRDWIELWVQNVDGLVDSASTFGENISNQILDQRWKKRTEFFSELDGQGFLHTGWESAHPRPAFLDVAKGRCVYLVDKDANAPWELCQDDGLLEAADLPPFSRSVFRYLYQPSAGKKTRFIPVVAGAPENDATVTLESALDGGKHLIPFNPQSGLMMACSFCPLGFEDYVDLLGGKPWQGIELGKSRLYTDSLYQSLENWDLTQQGDAFLFMGRHGRAGRFLEVFHLKLQLLRDACCLVRNFVHHKQVPFLNLSADSFRVQISKTGGALPFLWTARGVLASPGQAYPLPLRVSDFTYFLRAGRAGTSIYFPNGLGTYVQGMGSVRLRKVLSSQDSGTVLEGTLVAQERLTVSPRDLLSFQLPLQSGRIDLCGHLFSAEGLAHGEGRFRTISQRLPDTVTAALRAAEGVSFVRSPFEIVPLLSTPCDLYALGVLAVRTLLVDDKTTLAVALDEMLSLARQVAVEYDAGTEPGLRIKSLFERDQRYVASLGPQRLTSESIDAAVAFQRLPAELWWDTLAMIISQFPETGPDSVCRDFGDVTPAAMELVFDKTIAALDKLLVQTRSLLFLDWNLNREIHAVIQSQLDRIKD